MDKRVQKFLKSTRVDFDAGSKEGVAWVAGFFCGEGHITIYRSKQGSYTGTVGMSQKTLWPLNVAHLILFAHNIKIPEPRYSSGAGVFELNANRLKGTEFLLLIGESAMRTKHSMRARVYFKMFPPGERYVRRPAERKEIYAEWLQLRINEKGG